MTFDEWMAGNWPEDCRDEFSTKMAKQLWEDAMKVNQALSYNDGWNAGYGAGFEECRQLKMFTPVENG